ncbi:MAG TPA: hypothetical protein VM818_07275 [Vicinamibacterales bacterium]|jgi:hypothetical protein|nr:hypothetical protein [Vicinamibacterales bacterium]
MLARLAFSMFVLLGAQTALVALASAVRPRSNVYRTIIGVSVCTAPLALLYGSHHLGQPLGAEGRLHFVLIHLALGGFLFHFMTLPDRSVTLRILVEVLLAPGQALSVSALSARYGVKTMISSRLEQLSSGGFIEISDDRRINLTRKGAAFGRFVSSGRKLFGIASAN